MVLLSAVWAVHRVLHSPVFTVKVVELVERGEGVEAPPVDSKTLLELAAVRVGKESLFELELAAIERRILSHPWLREVRLEKRFPQTLSISPVFREPSALLQGEGGKLSYVDSTGQVFGKVKLGVHSDLPIFSTNISDAKGIGASLRLVEAWTSLGLKRDARIDSLDLDPERGLRAVVTYRLGGDPSKRGRATVELGALAITGGGLSDEVLGSRLRELRSVLVYLSDHRLAATQVWAGLGKKIVVKIAHGP